MILPIQLTTSYTCCLGCPITPIKQILFYPNENLLLKLFNLPIPALSLQLPIYLYPSTIPTQSNLKHHQPLLDCPDPLSKLLCQIFRKNPELIRNPSDLNSSTLIRSYTLYYWSYFLPLTDHPNSINIILHLLFAVSHYAYKSDPLLSK